MSRSSAPSASGAMPYLSRVRVVLREGTAVVSVTAGKQANINGTNEFEGLYVGRDYSGGFVRPRLQFRTGFDESLLVKPEDILRAEVITKYDDI